MAETKIQRWYQYKDGVRSSTSRPVNKQQHLLAQPNKHMVCWNPSPEQAKRNQKLILQQLLVSLQTNQVFQLTVTPHF